MSRILTALIAITACGIAGADVVKLSDGSLIHGEVQGLSDGKLTVETEFAGTIRLDWSAVVELETERPLVVQWNGREAEARIRAASEGEALLEESETEPPGRVRLADLEAINPPGETPPAVVWSGMVNGAASHSDGNTERSSASLRAEMTRRAEADRWNLKSGLQYGRDAGELSERAAFASTKYDYFVSAQTFLYAHAHLESDRFKDLSLRSTLGGGLGYQWLESDAHRLFTEAGLSWVHEDYRSDAKTEDFVAARLALSHEYWLVPELLQWVSDAELLDNLSQLEDWLLSARTDLYWHINRRWHATAGLAVRYDNRPASGTEELDTTATIGVGMKF